MSPRMYIFLNEGLKMSDGKACAQAGHAAIESFLISDKTVLKEWYKNKGFTKIILGAKDDQQMYNLERWFKDRGLKTSLVVDDFDEGDDFIYTLVMHPTALAIEVLTAENQHLTGQFALYGRKKKRIWF